MVITECYGTASFPPALVAGGSIVYCEWKPHWSSLVILISSTGHNANHSQGETKDANNIISTIASKATVNPEQALAAAVAAVPVDVETVIAVAPVALSGAAGYGLYCVVKTVTK